MTEEEFLNYFRARFMNFKPLEVRRKMIPKYDGKEVMKYNSMILGIQNYYNIATHINLDLNDVFFHIRVKIETRLKKIYRKKWI